MMSVSDGRKPYDGEGPEAYEGDGRRAYGRDGTGTGAGEGADRKGRRVGGAGAGDRGRRADATRLPEELRALGRSLDAPGAADGAETMVERV
ncbi:hypothetical protein PBV88_43480, partial [Streptomyces sp. T21Q-yed]|nr:hypothetical protein [Streptomyces sp. T21Q-yed]